MEYLPQTKTLQKILKDYNKNMLLYFKKLSDDTNSPFFSEINND